MNVPRANSRVARCIKRNEMPSVPKLGIAPASIPAWDRALALDKLANDAELLCDLIQIFLAEYPKQIETLRRSLVERDLEVATRIAHTIKGEVSQFCAPPATEASRQLEEAGHAGDMKRMSILLPALELYGAALCRALGGWAEDSLEH
jgi:two-component system, sensor histidine kinase and response regulator